LYVSHINLLQHPWLTSIDSPNMDGSMTLASMATHHVPIPPSFNPALIETHLDADPEDIMQETLSNTVSTTLEPNISAPILTKMNNEGSGTLADISAQAHVPATAKDERASDEMQMGIDTERTGMKEEVHTHIVPEVDPAPSVQKAISNGNYTTSAPVEDATPEVPVAIISTDTSVTSIEPASHTEESLTAESRKPELVKLEGCEVTNTNSTAKNTAASELEVIKTTVSEQTDPSTIDGLSEKHEIGSLEDLSPSTLVLEDTPKADGHDQEDKVLELVSPDHDSPLARESNSDAGRSDDTAAQIERLKATYESSGESQTAAGAESRSSLFGGPPGPKIPQPSSTIESIGIGPVAQTEIDDGFAALFPQKVPDAPSMPDHIMEEVMKLDLKFDLSSSNAMGDAEPEAEACAQQEFSSQPPSSDQDAKPDITALQDPTSADSEYRPTSPTHSHAPSNNSHTSQKSNASTLQDTIDIMNSDDPYGAANDSKETPEEFSRLENAADITSQNIIDPADNQPPCSCDYRCEHRVAMEFNLRPGPRQEGCVYLSNLVIDTDQSGTYDNENGKYPSAPNVDPEDLDEDEESLDGNRNMSGNRTTDPMGRYNTTIPLNLPERVIRDRRVFDEESSSSDESQIKSKKKRKKTKAKSSKTNKKSKNNSGISTPRASDNDDAQDVEIDEQASTLAPKLPAKKKAPVVTPNQTIVQMLQRLAKPHTTKLSYPITFNCPTASCSICTSASYAIHGSSSTPRNIKIYDFGSGSTEIPDANEAGRSKFSAATIKPKDTQLCLACTTNYMKILMCSNHDISPDISPPASSSSSQTPRAGSAAYSTADSQTTCSVCPAQATYTCDNKCGARFCDACAYRIYGKCEGSLSTMLESTPDEVGEEYPRGLRADAELLRKGGELWRFLGRMAGKRGS
jgi:hypothetical protein